MSPRLRSPLDGFAGMSAARGKYDPAPPPYPPGPDPRTGDCRHDWPSSWGVVGERQHECSTCGRWIWERSIWPAGPKEDSDG